MVEKLYKPNNKYPFICQPTTSKNDSSFSSDINGSQHSSNFYYPHHHQQTSSSLKPNLYLNQSNSQHQNHLTSNTIFDDQEKFNSEINNLFIVSKFNSIKI